MNEKRTIRLNAFALLFILFLVLFTSSSFFFSLGSSNTICWHKFGTSFFSRHRILIGPFATANHIFRPTSSPFPFFGISFLAHLLSVCNFCMERFSISLRFAGKLVCIIYVVRDRRSHRLNEWVRIINGYSFIESGTRSIRCFFLLFFPDSRWHSKMNTHESNCPTFDWFRQIQIDKHYLGMEKNWVREWRREWEEGRKKQRKRFCRKRIENLGRWRCLSSSFFLRVPD